MTKKKATQEKSETEKKTATKKNAAQSDKTAAKTVKPKKPESSPKKIKSTSPATEVAEAKDRKKVKTPVRVMGESKEKKIAQTTATPETSKPGTEKIVKTPKKRASKPKTKAHTEIKAAETKKNEEISEKIFQVKTTEERKLGGETEQVKAPEIAKKEPPKQKTKIELHDYTTVKEFALKISQPVAAVIKKALELGYVLSLNQKMDKTVSEVVGEVFDCEVNFSLISDEKTALDDIITGVQPRVPIVTVMGHVDHGKTTLLDAIRESDVAASEHGGITQHIGAYRVKTPKGDVAFLDTPGHEAFTALRARGSKATDIVILVVSAADGVMPQTIEAINHAKAAKVSIIVAINKIDIAGANPEKVKGELNQHGLSPEEWGGDTLVVEISARNKINIDKLLDAVHLQSELMELKCEPNLPAVGSIIESRLDPKRGPFITVMVRNGTLKAGDVFIAGNTYGKVRAMFDEANRPLREAGPSTPVAIIGTAELPEPGDKFYIVKSEKEAREKVEEIKNKISELSKKPQKIWGLGELAQKDDKVLRLVLKADVAGSLEAITDHIEKIEHPEFKIKIIHSGVGTVTESDINLAKTTGSAIIGFNIRAEQQNMTLAEKNGVEIRTYRVIYELFDDIKKALEGLLSPKLQETVAGKAEVRKIMKITKAGIVAGSYVSDGKIARNSKARLLRDGAIVYDGRISSLRRFKEDVQSVEKGFECGITLENFQDIKENDIIEAYSVEKVKRFL